MQKDNESIAKINFTKDYHLFKFFDANRETKPKHIESLVNDPTFTKNFYTCPIVVNDKYFIIDGQHRFKAAQKLDCGVYYTILQDAVMTDIINRNVKQKGWVIIDYLNFFSQVGFPGYKELYNIMESNAVQATFVITLMQEIVNVRHKTFATIFKSGNLDIVPHLPDIKELINTLASTMKSLMASRGKKYISPLLQKPYLAAFGFLFVDDKIKYYKIIQKLRETYCEFPFCPTRETALKVLEKSGFWRKTQIQNIMDI
jgi:hypothetical protein